MAVSKRGLSNGGAAELPRVIQQAAGLTHPSVLVVKGLLGS